MCFSLFTIPADNNQPKSSKSQKAKSTRAKSVFTWILLLTWVFLISFALISTTEPGWLKWMSQFGRAGEANTLADYGDNFLMQRNYSMAIAQYQKAIEIKPDHIGALVNLAIAYSLAGNHRQGLQVLENALVKTDMQEGTIYFNMGDILRRQGKYDQSIENYRKAISTEVEQDLVYQRLGSLYMEMGKYEDARQAFEKTLEIQNDLSTPFVKMLYRSLPFFEDKPDDESVIKGMLARGVSTNDMCNFSTDIIENLNSRNPEIAKIHNHLGYIYARQNNLPAALKHFEKSLQIWPDNSDAAKNLGIIKKAIEQNQIASAADKQT
jgi:tetratricopeptide (TPR) repeat protein